MIADMITEPSFKEFLASPVMIGLGLLLFKPDDVVRNGSQLSIFTRYNTLPFRLILSYLT
jgi:hypothetical protein